MSEMKQQPLSPSSSIDFSRLYLETPPDSPMDSSSDDFLLPEQFFSQTDDSYILESEDTDIDTWIAAYERACPKKTKPPSDLDKVVEFYNSIKKENNPQTQNLLNSLQIIIDSYKQQEAILTAATMAVFKELYGKQLHEHTAKITHEELRRREQLFGYPEKTLAQKSFNNASFALLDLRMQTEKLTSEWRQQSDSSLSSNNIFSKKAVPDTPGKIDPIRKPRNPRNTEKTQPHADLFSSGKEKNLEISIPKTSTRTESSKKTYLSPPRPQILESDDDEMDLDLRQTFAGGIEKAKWEQPAIIPFLNPYNSAYNKKLDPTRVSRNSSRFKFTESTAKKQPEPASTIKLSDSNSLLLFELSQTFKG
jgi:hypothetical protein